MRWISRVFRSASPKRSHSTILDLEMLESRAVPTASDASYAFIGKAYVDVLQRPVDKAGSDFWGDTIDRGASHAQVAFGLLTSQEYRTTLVVRDFQTFLLRAPEQNAITFFVTQLGTGQTPEQVAAQILGSPEYFQSRGAGTTDGFLTALYADTLGRPLDAGGRAFFTNALNNGATRQQVAQTIFASAEYQTAQVRSFYQTFLRRPADAAGLAFFVNAFQQTGNSLQVQSALLGSDEYGPGASDTGSIQLSPDDVQVLLQRAAAASGTNDAIIAITDRNGRILGVRVEAGVAPEIVNNTANLVFAIDGAVSKARTGAFFANDTAPLTTRTVAQISQSTITQREVESYPSITDPNSTLKGPGFVAPVGTGGHFPPNVNNTPPVDLFGIEHTNRDTTVKNGVVLPERFNANPDFVPPGAELTPPDSYGFVSGMQPGAQPRGIATLPGGLPIYKFGSLVGGIGVFFPGKTGFGTEENSRLSQTFDPNRLDRSFEAEYIGFAAAGGSATAGYPIGVIAGVPLPNGFGLPFGAINLAGISLDLYGPGGTEGPKALVAYGMAFGTGNPNSGVNAPLPGVGAATNNTRAGRPVPAGWLVLPHDGVGITQADVNQLVNQGITQALQTRAQIRLPAGNSRTRMVFAVSDSTGEVLGLYRMSDATVFSIDVAVAKSRNAVYYANPSQLQPQDQVAGIPSGVAFTARTFRYLAQPRFPEGIDGTFPAPFSSLLSGGANPTNGVQVGPRLPASAYQTPYGYDAFNPGTNFRAPTSPLNQNGVVFFPGSSAIYKDTTGAGIRFLVAGAGVSGDGVDQDDFVTAGMAQNFTPPANLRVDNFFVQSVRMPYAKFPRNPLE